MGSITPWNWPLLIATWHIMQALRVGCTAVIKPASFTPLSTLRMVELVNKVLPGTDIAPLLEPLFWGCFINAGQTCAALKRLYVHEGDFFAVAPDADILHSGELK